MGYMKSLDLSERFSKLTDPQKNAVINIMSGGTETIRPATYKALESRGLIVKNGEAWELEGSFYTDLMDAVRVPEPREVDGDFTPENIARAMADIEAEVDDEYDNHPMLTVEQERSLQSDEGTIIPFFNRKALRALRRAEGVLNRRKMREQGKRIKKYGADDPKYWSRVYFGTNAAA